MPVGSDWDGEDDDNYRFLADSENLLGVEIVRLSHSDGLGVWGTIFQQRKISIRGAGGLMFAPCSRALKMKIVDAYAATIEEEITQVLGLTWMEDERVLRARERARGGGTCDVWFPSCEAPFLDNCHIAAYLDARGVQPPASYRQGYKHSNCGGACVKAGLSPWAALLRDNRGRFLFYAIRALAGAGRAPAVLSDKRPRVPLPTCAYQSAGSLEFSFLRE